MRGKGFICRNGLASGSSLKNCLLCGTEYRCRNAQFHVRKYCTKKCRNTSDRGKTPWNKGKGTISSENELFRKTKAYIDWRNSVYERDNYTCQFCNERGGKLNADHILPFAYFPKDRLDINNGRTLCSDCHRKTGTYGRRADFLRK